MICDTSMETPCYCVVHLAKGQCNKRLSSAASLYKRDAGKERAGQLETQTLPERRIIRIVQSSEVNQVNQVSFFCIKSSWVILP